MAIREYIGARYVPRFTGLYDNTQSYEALDVVDNGSGTSYIAKKPTPAGTPLTDTDYWFLYGSTNGAIVNLQQQINDMKDGTVPGSLQEQIDTINNTTIPAIQDDVSFLLNKRYILLMDSYGARTNVDGVRLDNLILTNLGGSNNVSLQVNGAGFTMDNGVITFQQMLTNATIADHDTVTDIIVLGGSNDYTSSVSDIKTAIRDFIYYANGAYPNAQVSVGAIGRGRTRTNIDINYTRVLPAYRYCVAYGAKYLNNVEYVMHNSGNYESDNVHPNANGVTELRNAVVEAIRTGSCNVNYEVSPAYTAVTTSNWTGYQQLSNGNYYEYINNGFCGMRCAPSCYFKLDYTGSGISAQEDIIGFAETSSNILIVGQPANNAQRMALPIKVDFYKTGWVYTGTGFGSLWKNNDNKLCLTVRSDDADTTNCIQIKVTVLGGATLLTQEC